MNHIVLHTKPKIIKLPSLPIQNKVHKCTSRLTCLFKRDSANRVLASVAMLISWPFTLHWMATVRDAGEFPMASSSFLSCLNVCETSRTWAFHSKSAGLDAEIPITVWRNLKQSAQVMLLVLCWPRCFFASWIMLYKYKARRSGTERITLKFMDFSSSPCGWTTTQDSVPTFLSTNPIINSAPKMWVTGCPSCFSMMFEWLQLSDAKNWKIQATTDSTSALNIL